LATVERGADDALHPEIVQSPDQALALVDRISQRTLSDWNNAFLVMNQAVHCPETIIVRGGSFNPLIFSKRRNPLY